MDMQGLTPDEIEVAKLAGQLYLKFKQLPQAHPADLGEMAHHVHAIGRIVFALVASGWIEASADDTPADFAGLFVVDDYFA